MITSERQPLPEALAPYGPGEPLTGGELQLLKEIKQQGLSLALLTLEPASGDVFMDRLDPLGALSEAGEIAISKLHEAFFSEIKMGYRRAQKGLTICLRARLLRSRVDDPVIFNIAGKLAETLHLRGDMSGAHRLREYVFEGLLSAFGPEHPDTLAAAGDFAQTLCSEGDLNEGRRLAESVYEVRHRVLGAEHADTLRAAVDLAGVLRLQGNFLDAIYLGSFAYEISKRVLGNMHEVTRSAYRNLARIFFTSCKILLAHGLRLFSYHFLLGLLGEEHSATFAAAQKLETLSRRSPFVATRNIHESTYELLQAALGADHFLSLNSAKNLGLSLLGVDDFAGARRLLEHVYRSHERIYGVKHSLTLTGAGNLAILMYRQGDVSGARQLEESVYEALLSSRDVGDSNSLMAVLSLAICAYAQGDVWRALRLSKQVCESGHRKLGPAHSVTLRASHYSANYFLWDQVQQENGENQLQGIASAAKRVVFLLRSLTTLTTSGETLGIMFTLAAECVLLRAAPFSWPIAVTAELRELLPHVSAAMTQRLEVVPSSSWKPLLEAYRRFHQRWAWWSLQHEPLQLTQALAALHGVSVWREFQEELEQEAEHSGKPEAVAYVAARRNLDQIRRRVIEVQANIDKLETQVLQWPSDEEGEGSAGARSKLRQRPYGISVGLTHYQAELKALEQADREGSAGLARARESLAQADPGLQGRLMTPVNVDAAVIASTLGETHAWMTFLRREDGRTIAYLLRKSHEHEVIDVGRLELLSEAAQRFTSTLSERQRGMLRDGESVTVSDGQTSDSQLSALEPLTLSELRELCEQSFWQPLQQALQSVSVLNLVTGPEEHALLLECGQPLALQQLRVQRYCGLPAYQRLRMSEQSTAGASGGEAIFANPSWDSDCPIPFTQTEVLLAQRFNAARNLSAEQLIAADLQAERLVLSTHGETRGAGTRRHGVIVLEEQQHLELQQLGAIARSIGELYSLSCYGGQVGSSEAGDSLGLIAELQLRGVEWATACLAPVSDLHAPLLSALVWHARAKGLSPLEALQEGKRQLRHGPWPEELLAGLEQAFRQVMLQVLDRARYRAGDDRERFIHARRAMMAVAAWPMAQGRRAQFFGYRLQDLAEDEQRALLQRFSESWCEHEQEREEFIQPCLQQLLAGPERWQQQLATPGHPYTQAAVQALQDIEILSAVTVCFGGKQ